MEDKYEDIIGYNYEGVRFHPHMNATERSAQFSPFAALTGLDKYMKSAEKTD